MLRQNQRFQVLSQNFIFLMALLFFSFSGCIKDEPLLEEEFADKDTVANGEVNDSDAVEVFPDEKENNDSNGNGASNDDDIVNVEPDDDNWTADYCVAEVYEGGEFVEKTFQEGEELIFICGEDESGNDLYQKKVCEDGNWKDVGVCGCLDGREKIGECREEESSENSGQLLVCINGEWSGVGKCTEFKKDLTEKEIGRPEGGYIQGRPSGITIYENAIYVTIDTNNALVKLDKTGTVLDWWNSSDWRDGSYSVPVNELASITVAGDTILLGDLGKQEDGDYKHSKLVEILLDGTFKAQYPSFQYESGGTFYNRLIQAPFGLASGDDNLIYVSNGFDACFDVYDLDSGLLIKKVGGYGVGDGSCIDPKGIDIDSEGNVHIADSKNCRIQVFSNSGDHIRSYGRVNNCVEEKVYPYAVAIGSDGTSYVTYNTRKMVMSYDSDGEFISAWGEDGIGFSSESGYNLFDPKGIAVDNDYIYVVDASSKNRIQIFKKH